MASALRARTHPTPRVDGVREPRPAALMAAAAAVPLAAAVLFTAGLLPWGSRLALGVAVVVLGVALTRSVGTVTGARIGAPTARGLGAAIVLGGAAIAGGALAAGSGAELSVAAFLEDDGPTIRPWGPLILFAAIAAAGAWVARSSPAIGGPVVGVTLALIVVALLAIVGAGPVVQMVVMSGAAIVATGVVLRGRAPRVALLGASLGASMLVAWTASEILGVTQIASGLMPGGAEPGALSPGLQALQLAIGQAVVALIAATALTRRDPAGALLAAGVLLALRPADTTTARVGLLVVPILVLLVALSAIGSDGVRRTLTVRAPAALRDAGWRVTTEAAWAGLSATLVVLAVTFTGVLSGSERGGGIVAAVLLVGAAAIAWRASGPAAIATTSLVLVGIGDLQPLVRVVMGGSLGDHRALALVVLVVGTAGATVALVRRIPHPVVLAAATFLVAGSCSYGLMLARDLAAMADTAWSLTITVGPQIVLLIVVGVLVPMVSDAAVRSLQAIGAVLAFVAGTAALQMSYAVLSFAPESGPALVDTGRVVAVLLLVGLALGCALLAASTARRPSVAVTLGVVAGTIGLALFAATVSAGTADVVRDVMTMQGPAGSIVRPVDLTFGFTATASGLNDADGAWPVLLAIVGLVLAGAGAWLESRRPLPADAPVAKRDRPER